MQTQGHAKAAGKLLLLLAAAAAAAGAATGAVPCGSPTGRWTASCFNYVIDRSAGTIAGAVCYNEQHQPTQTRERAGEMKGA